MVMVNKMLLNRQIKAFQEQVRLIMLNCPKKDYIYKRYALKSLEINNPNFNNEDKKEAIHQAKLFFNQLSKDHFSHESLPINLNKFLKLELKDLEKGFLKYLNPVWEHCNQKYFSLFLSQATISIFGWEDLPHPLGKVIQKGLFTAYTIYQKKIPEKRVLPFIKAFMEYIVYLTYSSAYILTKEDDKLKLEEVELFLSKINEIFVHLKEYPFYVLAEEDNNVSQIYCTTKGLSQDEINKNIEDTEYLLDIINDMSIKPKEIKKEAEYLAKDWTNRKG